MRLDAGERLGPYEILEPFGAGGIGEVKKVSLDRGVSLRLTDVTKGDPSISTGG